MCKTPCVENISYIYYSGANGSITNGPKCHICMNEALRSGGLNDVAEVLILTTSGLLPFPIRCLIFLYGISSPFSIKDMAEVPVVMNCVQCCVKNSSEFSSKDSPAKLASADVGLVAQEGFDGSEINCSRTEEAHSYTVRVKVDGVQPREPSQNIAGSSQPIEAKRKLPFLDGPVAKRVKTECEETPVAGHSYKDTYPNSESVLSSSHTEFGPLEQESSFPKNPPDGEPPRRFLNIDSIISVDHRATESLSTRSAPHIQRSSTAELHYQRSRGRLQESNNPNDPLNWFPFLNGRRRDSVNDPIDTFGHLSAQMIALMRNDKDVSMDVILGEFFDIRKRIHCRVCDCQVQINAKGFEHFLAKRHFSQVLIRKGVFSFSQDFDLFRRIIENGRAKYNKPGPAIEQSRFIRSNNVPSERLERNKFLEIVRPKKVVVSPIAAMDFPFLRGKKHERVHFPIDSVTDIMSAIQSLSDEVVTRSKFAFHAKNMYFPGKDFYFCVYCREDIDTSRLLMHILSSSHLRSVLSKGEVFCKVQDYERLQSIFTKIRKDFNPVKSLPSSSRLPFGFGKPKNTLNADLPFETIYNFITALQFSGKSNNGFHDYLQMQFREVENVEECSHCGTIKSEKGSSSVITHFFSMRHIVKVIRRGRVFTDDMSCMKILYREYLEKTKCEDIDAVLSTLQSCVDEKVFSSNSEEYTELARNIRDADDAKS